METNPEIENQNIPPQPIIPSMPKKHFGLKFFITVAVILLLSGTVYGGIWWWGNSNSQVAMTAYTPRPANDLPLLAADPSFTKIFSYSVVQFKYPNNVQLQPLEDKSNQAHGYISWSLFIPKTITVNFFIHNDGYSDSRCAAADVYKKLVLATGQKVPICLGYDLGDKSFPEYDADIPLDSQSGGKYIEFQSSATSADEQPRSEQFLEQLLSTFKFTN